MFLNNVLKIYARLQSSIIRRSLSFSKTHKRHKDKFHLDYEYFSNVPLDMRDFELQRIISLPKSNIQLVKDIPFFPLSEYWDYHGLKLMTHLWEPNKNTKPRAVVVFFHSLNGHTGMCGQLARQLASAGLVVTGFDFPNFGQSQGQKRGLIQSVDELVTISQQFIIKVKTKYPNLKIFVCGMSLGGAVAFNISIRSPKLANGLIMLSPSIRQNRMHYPFLKKLTLMLSIVLPYQQLLKSSARNGSKYKLDDYSKKDPYIYQGRVWTKTTQQLLFFMAKTTKLYKQLSSPYLLVQSGSDKLVDPFACLDLEKASPSSDKSTVIIHGMWHAVWFDDHVYDVIKIIEEWLQQRI